MTADEGPTQWDHDPSRSSASPAELGDHLVQGRAAIWCIDPDVRLPFRVRLQRAAAQLTRVGIRISLLSVALAGILLPGNRVSRFAYPLLFGVPLAIAAVRRRGDRAFVLWTTYALSFVLFSVLRNAADETGVAWQIASVASAERILWFGNLPTVALQHLLYSPGEPTALDWAAVSVHLSYYVVPPLLGIILWVQDQLCFERYMVAISITYLGGLAIHFAVPAAPPWLAAQLGVTPPIHRILYDLVHGLSPSFYNYGYRVAGGNEVAALPSLHMAAAWLAALAWRGRPKWKWVGASYALAMGFGLVYTGEHYVIDELAGMGLAAGAWLLAGGHLRRRGRVRVR